MADRDRSTPYQRYRVEERDGRLVVIDDGAPRRPPTRRGSTLREGQSVPRLYRGIAAMLCKGRTDASGRPVFTTDKRDSKGPRSFALDPPGIRRLAHWTLATGLLATAMIGMVLVDIKLGISISAIFGAALSAGGKRTYTRWADGFGNPLIDD